jgi:hypothetical protein
MELEHDGELLVGRKRKILNISYSFSFVVREESKFGNEIAMGWFGMCINKKQQNKIVLHHQGKSGVDGIFSSQQ